ncbi:MAG: hypothetical protein HWQ35_31745 [Nostoc sp. NMS1]|uniref:hypothetical protein n=1 Tax=unclassified Nostoc TaxID=2593658 RepID=UPI0025D194EA|nr:MULTISPECIES: hypothetical protein [unclassified Nostoc]MBN3910949.1 hypothetical protein [Nostoc sp. NMS1]MBN3994707.1 hypothetical protein [Nostoc sp. NMS2]
MVKISTVLLTESIDFLKSFIPSRRSSSKHLSRAATFSKTMLSSFIRNIDNSVRSLSLSGLSAIDGQQILMG